MAQVVDGGNAMNLLSLVSGIAADENKNVGNVEVKGASKGKRKMVEDQENSSGVQNAAKSVKVEGKETAGKVVIGENGEQTVDVASGSVADGNVRKRKAGRRWTANEDAVLRQLVEKNGNRHWKKIAKEFAKLSGSERSDVQCLHRWNKCLKPGLLKGPWTPEEDATIKRMIEEHGGPQNVRWSVIAKNLKGRLGKQVRERWINHLDPTLIKTEWTPEEDETLYQLQKRFGNRWKWVSELMPGRSENAVKNRWHSIKPSIQARNGEAPVSNKKDTSGMSGAAKSAAAAAVAVVANAAKKKRTTVNTKKSRSKKKSTSSSSTTSSPSSSPSNGGLADLLSIGQTLQGGNSSTSMDLAAVAEKAKELLRMSLSYREMAQAMLGKGKPPSPLFNDLVQREIQDQIHKQFGSSSSSSSGMEDADGNPLSVLTQFSPSQDGQNTSPLASDPVLFNQYFNTFAKSLTNNSMQLNNMTQLFQQGDKKDKSDQPISPHQLLAAAAAVVSSSASNSPTSTKV